MERMFSPPEEALRLLRDAFNQTNQTKYWTASVVGGNSFDPILPELRETMQLNRGTFLLTHDEPEIHINGKEATLTVQTTLQNNLFFSLSQTETLHLRKLELEVQTLWQVVPGVPEEIALDPNCGVLLRTATCLAFPREMLDLTQTQITLRNLRRLALGVLMYDVDYDGRKEALAIDFKKAVMPYLQEEHLFYSPADKSGNVSYSFNQKLVEPIDPYTEPLDVVMIYDGTEGQLEFRHNNQAAVGFINGQSKLVTPEEAKSLRWEP